MRTVFLIIATIIMINAILYGVFAFTIWELNPKYWDVFPRGIFLIVSIFVTPLCGAGVYHEINKIRK